MKNGDFLTKKTEKKAKKIVYFWEKKSKNCHGPFSFAICWYYLKTTLKSIKMMDFRSKILEKSCFLAKTEVRFWPLYGGDINNLDQSSQEHDPWAYQRGQWQFFLNSLKNGDFLTKKRRKKQIKWSIFEEKKSKNCYGPFSFAICWYYLKTTLKSINMMDFRGQILEKSCFFGQNGGSFLATVWWWYTYFRSN